MTAQKSLQRELYKWVIISALVLLLLGGAIAGILSFKQARELQDNTLKEISLLVRNGQLNFSDFKDLDDDRHGYEKDHKKGHHRKKKRRKHHGGNE